MKTKCQKQKPTKCKFSVLRQICNFIPNHLVPQLAPETGVADDARTYTPWSHVLTLLFAQLTHSLGLNDVCDALALHSGPLSAIRGARLRCFRWNSVTLHQLALLPPWYLRSTSVLPP